LVLSTASDLLRTKEEMLAENLFLRKQMILLKRQVKRPKLTWRDRLGMVFLARLCRNWRDSLLIVRPETLLRWHRELYRVFWRWKSRVKVGRKPFDPKTIELIKWMAEKNFRWGAEKIRGELLKLGIRISKRTIQKYLRQVRRRKRSGQRWLTFVHNHLDQIWACDFLQVHDVFFRDIFLFVIMELHSRRVLHAAVTRSPCDEWVTQQFKNVLLDEDAPRFLNLDRDDKYGAKLRTVTDSENIRQLKTPIRAPRANAFCERLLGSARRECFDHILVLGEEHLRQVASEYFRYHNECRPHQGLGQKIPSGRQPQSLSAFRQARLEAKPILGGLHHDYSWVEAAAA
jgi:transposase InsO family protein